MPAISELAVTSRTQKLLLLRRVMRQKIQQANNVRTACDDTRFLSDADLDPSIEPCGTAKPLSAASAILLTGAAGFLGAHLLRDLCRLTNTTIYCLVRSHEIDARRRIEENLARYTDAKLPAQRIVLITGDLSKPLLGLTETRFAQLSFEIDAIFHNGAVINHLAPYGKLRAANVLSTVDLLRLAASRKSKWIYYVSSMIAAVNRNADGCLVEQLPDGDGSEITGGYAQTKWICERLLSQAQARGFGVTVYRPGIIGGRSDTGAWAVTHDHLLLLLKSCCQMGCAPESSQVVDLTPVDFVSEATVRLSVAGVQYPVAHLSNPHLLTWNTLVGWMNECGYRIQQVPSETWQKFHLTRISENNALFPLLPVYLEESAMGRRQLLISKLAKVSREFTMPMLSGLGLTYPAINRDLWQRYVQYCQTSGFFPLPHQGTNI
jgi:thioester reductase-like protein